MLIGSKEGIAHLPWAYLEEGDTALVPSPGYPVYGVTTLLAGAAPHVMPLREENGFMPVFDDIPEDVLKKAKVCFLNYPNNPTGAHADDALFEKALERPAPTTSSSATTPPTANSPTTATGRRASSSSTGRSATPSSSSPSRRLTA